MLVRLFTVIFLSVYSVRWQGVNGWNSTRFGYVSRAGQVDYILTWFVVALHKVLSKMNKMDRLLILFSAFVVEIDGIL
jgi:hypothetical protein